MSNLCETLMGPLTGDSKMNKQVHFWSFICHFLITFICLLFHCPTLNDKIQSYSWDLRLVLIFPRLDFLFEKSNEWAIQDESNVLWIRLYFRLFMKIWNIAGQFLYFCFVFYCILQFWLDYTVGNHKSMPMSHYFQFFWWNISKLKFLTFDPFRQPK